MAGRSIGQTYRTCTTAAAEHAPTARVIIRNIPVVRKAERIITAACEAHKITPKKVWSPSETLSNYAYVTFESHEAAKKACTILNGIEVKGMKIDGSTDVRNIDVQMNKSQELRKHTQDRTLIVRNIPWNVSYWNHKTNAIENLFKEYPPVEINHPKRRIKMGMKYGDPADYVAATYETAELAEKAFESLKAQTIGGQPVEVCFIDDDQKGVRFPVWRHPKRPPRDDTVSDHREVSKEFKQVLVGSLPEDCRTVEAVREMFRGYSPTNVAVIKDAFTGEPEGYAKVWFATPYCASKACEELNGVNGASVDLMVYYLEKKFNKKLEAHRKRVNAETVVLRGLPEGSRTKEAIETLLKDHGPVNIICDASESHAKISFASPEAAQAASTAIHGTSVGGVSIQAPVWQVRKNHNQFPFFNLHNLVSTLVKSSY